MPNFRFRKRLLDRLMQGANAAGEAGLALLMTAGVVHCGGSTTTGPADGAPPDGSGYSDGHVAPEAAQEGGTVVEAAIEAAIGWDGGPQPVVEAPAPVPDAGTDAPHPVVEAPPPPQDAGSDARHPMIEAPAPAPSDASADHFIWVEAAKAP